MLFPSNVDKIHSLISGKIMKKVVCDFGHGEAWKSRNDVTVHKLSSVVTAGQLPQASCRVGVAAKIVFTYFNMSD